MLEVHVLRALSDNFIYVLRAAGQVAVVDPSTANVVETFLTEKAWSLQQIICTHHHWDHVGGAVELSRKFSAPILCSDYDQSRIEGASQTVGDGDLIQVVGLQAQVISIPGHTLGHWALHFPSENCVFVGDTLFSAGCGRLFEGTPAQMFESLNKLKSHLKPDTRIYFGHEYTERNLAFVAQHCPGLPIERYLAHVQGLRAEDRDSTPTTLAQELEVNPFLRAKTVDEFRRIRELRNEF